MKNRYKRFLKAVLTQEKLDNKFPVKVKPQVRHLIDQEHAQKKKMESQQN